MSLQSVPDKRTRLLNAAVRVIAENGLENTSVSDICTAAGVNVVYVYRYFENKEIMIATAFNDVDEEFLRVILRNFQVLQYNSIDYEMRCRFLFMKCWEFLIARPRQLIFFVRYYYSSSFRKYAYAEHMKRYAVLIERMSTAFPESVDIRTVLHHILDTLLGEAIKQISDPNGSNDAAGERSFSLIFSVVKSYVRQDKLY